MLALKNAEACHSGDMITETASPESEDRLITVYVNAGGGSLDNGAVHPMSKLRTLAAAADCVLEFGSHYGDDRLLVLETEWPVVEEILREEKLLYRVQGKDTEWRNVQPGSKLESYLQRMKAAHMACA